MGGVLLHCCSLRVCGLVGLGLGFFLSRCSVPDDSTYPLGSSPLSASLLLVQRASSDSMMDAPVCVCVSGVVL